MKHIQTINLDDFSRLTEEEARELLIQCLETFRNQTAPPPPPQLHECSICCSDDIRRQNMYIAPCGHGFCLDCLRDAFKSHVEINGNPFQCQQTGCKVIINIYDITLYNLYNDDQKLLSTYCNQVTINKYKGVIKTCPHCQVDSFVENPSEKIKCGNPKCNKEFCGLCSCEYHPGHTCEQYASFLIAQNTDPTWTDDLKPCPNCHVPILKNEGCKWMHCIHCNAFFCWVCLQVTYDHKHKEGQVCTPHGDLNKK